MTKDTPGAELPLSPSPPVDRDPVGAPVESCSACREGRALRSAALVHGMKGPVAAMMLTAELLDAHGDARVSSLGNDVLAAADALRRSLADLLDLERGEARELRVRRASVDVRAWFADATRWVLRKLPRLGLTSDVLFAAPRRARLDGDLAARVLASLVDHAIAHAPRGAKLQVDLRPSSGHGLQLRVAAAAPSPSAAGGSRSVSPPLDPDRLAVEGSGPSHDVGLAFCRAAALAHGGSMFREPAADALAFVVELPGDHVDPAGV